MNPLSRKCTALAKSTRQRCERWVIGGGPCPMHGGKAPQVAVRREACILEAQAMSESLLAGVRWLDRAPGEALLAAAADADALVQRIKWQVVQHEVIDPASLMALGDWIDRVGRLSKLVLDAR